MGYRILNRHTVFDRYFRIDELKYEGPQGQSLSRLVLERGNSVGILLHDPEKQQVLLCEQFRPATGSSLLEIPAGMIDNLESPDQAARRETSEETGYDVGALRKIAEVYLSPGCTSEKMTIFYGEVKLQDKPSGGYGLQEEGEDIRLVPVGLAEALELAAGDAIQDAKTLIALQWLALSRS